MKILTYAIAAGFACTTAFADSYPVTINDGRAVEVTLEQKPETVAALWAAAADLLVALDTPVLGVTTYEGKMPVYLGEKLNGALDYGDITAPNLELLSTSKPDLTIGLTRYNAPYSDEIEAIGQFLTFDGFSFEQSMASVSEMGRALGRDADVAAMNRDYIALINDYAARAPKEQKEAVFIWSFHDTLYGYRENLTTADIIKQAGTSNPLGRAEQLESADDAFVVLEAEDLLAIDPDVIFMFISHGGAAKFNAAYERLKAYKAGQIYSVGYQYSQPSGPIAREMILREVAHLVYPETFEKPDMPDTARATQVEFAK
ncbi:iron complex transport system substrate-binding protein [Aliiroseovarius halocynthiae]|nr:ABC transporter substrate-binding protein [Aliiroseovarius halocynthiae]SMR83533.1 iron complex transport system substrate-binding protein [Aliiroseovarius halocynthiae]